MLLSDYMVVKKLRFASIKKEVALLQLAISKQNMMLRSLTLN